MLAFASRTTWILVSVFGSIEGGSFLTTHLAEGGKPKTRIIDLDVDIGADAVDYKCVRHNTLPFLSLDVFS